RAAQRSDFAPAGLASRESVNDVAPPARRVARRALVRHAPAARADASRCRFSVALSRCHSHPMSMLRYYMTPETRQAVIAESNRLIATRAAMSASRSRGESHDLDAVFDDRSRAAEAGTDTEPSSVESAFARLVADLQSAAAASRDR